MKRKLKIGEHLFIPVMHGETIIDSQGKPRIYASEANFDKNATFAFCDADLYEYAPIRYRDFWGNWHNINEVIE